MKEMDREDRLFSRQDEDYPDDELDGPKPQNDRLNRYIDSNERFPSNESTEVSPDPLTCVTSLIISHGLDLKEEQSIHSLLPTTDGRIFIGVLSVRLRDCCIGVLETKYNHVRLIMNTTIPPLYMGRTKAKSILYSTTKSSVVMETSEDGLSKDLLDLTPYDIEGMYVSPDDTILSSLSSTGSLALKPKVIKMTLEGKILKEWAEDGEGTPLFQRPGPLTESMQRLVFLVDGYSKILAIANGKITDKFECKIGSRFVALECDKYSTLFVCDVKNHRVKMFDRHLKPTGEVDAWSTPIRNPVYVRVMGEELYVAHDDNKISQIALAYIHLKES